MRVNPSIFAIPKAGNQLHYYSIQSLLRSVYLILVCHHTTGIAQLDSVQNSNFTTSEGLSDSSSQLSRLSQSEFSGAWQVANPEVGVWIQAYLTYIKVIVKVATQGYEGQGKFVTSYKMATHHGGELEYILNAVDSERIFAANTNDSDIVENCIASVQANTVRLCPQSWQGGLALRWDVYVDEDLGKKILLKTNSNKP